jgi:hypothetical protein
MTQGFGELPMATSDCSLDLISLLEQSGRYRQLEIAAAMLSGKSESSPSFDGTLDAELLRDQLGSAYAMRFRGAPP